MWLTVGTVLGLLDSNWITFIFIAPGFRKSLELRSDICFCYKYKQLGGSERGRRWRVCIRSRPVWSRLVSSLVWFGCWSHFVCVCVLCFWPGLKLHKNKQTGTRTIRMKTKPSRISGMTSLFFHSRLLDQRSSRATLFVCLKKLIKGFTVYGKCQPKYMYVE